MEEVLPGGDLVEADVAVRDGTIAAVGKDLPKGDQEINAAGKLVTPGFVDVHTHYDAQVTWSNRITPSSWNGVTTLMMGNCGVGFAPCKPEQRDMLIELMEGVEDIPEVVLTEGLPWNWESFEDYLNALDARQYDLDVVAQVPHAAVRTYVMGERALAHEPANAEDRAQMAKIAAAGIEAGALGFSTSRTINHKTLAGEHTPTLKAEADELIEIAGHPKVVGIGETGLDFHYGYSPKGEQFQSLTAHIDAARRTDLPLILHTREADQAMADLLEDEMGKGAFRPLLHCYTGGTELAHRASKLGAYFAASGIITFKKAEDVRAVFRDEVADDRVIVETDCPYLAPVPHRGRRCEPAFLPDVAHGLAQVKGWTDEVCEQRTTENFFRLFDRVPRP